VDADRFEQSGVVDIAADEADGRALVGVLGPEGGRGVHDVDTGHLPGTRLLGQEAERPVDAPHAADVQPAPAEGQAADERLARLGAPAAQALVAFAGPGGEQERARERGHGQSDAIGRPG